MKILITGGAGSIGGRLVKKLYEQGHKITIQDIDETRLYFMLRDEYNYDVSIYTCDIKDEKAVDDCLSQGFDAVIHTAAYKHVPTGEYHPDQMVNVNILGALNVFRSAIKHRVKRVVVVSTDKAAYPTGVMGASKLIQERMALNMNEKSETSFNVVRFGNVVMSRGGVIERFSLMIKKGKRLQLMDNRMTRFWMDFDDAVNLILKALHDESKGCVFSRITTGWRLTDLARAFSVSESGWDIIGRRKGEKIHEVLITDEECERAEVLSDNYVKVRPEGKHNNKSDLKRQVRSDNNLMSVDEIKKKLSKAGML